MKKQEKTANKEKEAKSSKGINVKRFIFTYVILMGAFFAMIGFTPFQKVIDINGVYTEGVVLATSKFLSFFNIPATYRGSIIQLPSLALDVKFGCNGLEAVMIYSVAVLAFPSTWKKKLLGVLAGFIIIQVINVLRIVGLVYAGLHFKNFFEYVHIYIAQGMMIAIALGVFFMYLHYVRSDGKPA